MNFTFGSVQRQILLVLLGTVLLSACQKPAGSDAAANTDVADAAGPSLDSDKDKLSYALGLSLGTQMSADNMDIALDNFASGFGHGMGEGEALMTTTEVQQRLQAFSQQRRDEQQAKIEKAAEENRQAGETWLADNAKKDGVVTTESGLQYKVLTEGDGKKPSETDTVSVHYRGTLLDGTEFDSSYSRGEPAEFPVNRVIAGWTEALQLMTVGSKWELYIPSDMAYGPAGTGREIGPNQTLMFEVELLEIKAAAE
ncbi:MAG: FKBP-type peptidyl-prolyl cis-trans isomerase [Pseudomonadales bacterium]